MVGSHRAVLVAAGAAEGAVAAAEGGEGGGGGGSGGGGGFFSKKMSSTVRKVRKRMGISHTNWQALLDLAKRFKALRSA